MCNSREGLTILNENIRIVKNNNTYSLINRGAVILENCTKYFILDNILALQKNNKIFAYVIQDNELYEVLSNSTSKKIIIFNTILYLVNIDCTIQKHKEVK